MKSGIYRILNAKNGKFYIGSSTNCRRRFNQHKSALRKGKHDNIYLQRAWAKYSEESFIFEILELTEDLQNREDFYLKSLKPPYNLSFETIPGRDLRLFFANLTSEEKKSWIAKRNFTFAGKKHSEESKLKMSKALKGRITVNAKPVSCDGSIFPSCNRAAKYLGVNMTTISWRVKHWPDRYFLV